MASTRSAPPTSRRSTADAGLQLKPRPGPERHVPRHQQHLRAVRQRGGPPGDRHGHRPAAPGRRLFPPGSEVATHFTPCAIPNGCAGDPWYEFDPAWPRRRSPRPASRMASRRRSSTATRRGRTCRTRRRRAELQAQLQANLGIGATIEASPRRPSSTTPTPASSTASTSSAGRRLSGRHASSIRASGRAPRRSSATSSTTSPRRWPPGASAATAPSATRPTSRPTTPSGPRPDGPGRAPASAVAYRPT